MKINKNGISLDEYSLHVERVCKEPICGKKYTIQEYLDESEYNFYPPVSYIKGCSRFCLSCWLGVTEHNDADDSGFEGEDHGLDLCFPDDHSHWYDESNYREIDLGDLSKAYEKYINDGCHLAILPLSRIATHRSIFLPYGVMIYPEGRLSFDALEFNNNDECELSYLQSSMSGISIAEYSQQPLLVLPIKVNWRTLLRASHKKHMDMIRAISEVVDYLCLNFIQYKLCELTYMPDEGLPNSAGQVNSNSMMASSLFLKNGGDEAKLISGSAFSHRITRGVGLVLNQPEWDTIPSEGGICKVIQHALFLYSDMIKTESTTSRYIQAMNLLEYLAFPREYKNFKKVKTVISRYVASNESERIDILNRFEELTGKIDSNTGKQIGIRTRIIHVGARLEDLVKNEQSRIDLFRELDNYIRSVIDHMIEHSSLTYDEYEDVKKQM